MPGDHSALGSGEYLPVLLPELRSVFPASGYVPGYWKDPPVTMHDVHRDVE